MSVRAASTWGSDKPSVAHDDVTSDDHGLDVGGARIEHHDCDGVPESVQMRRESVEGVIDSVPRLATIKSNSSSLGMLPCA
jgi:hypothetical protein